MMVKPGLAAIALLFSCACLRDGFGFSEGDEACQLMVSADPTRLGAVPIDAGPLTGTVYVFLSGCGAADVVSYWLDDAALTTGDEVTSTIPPFDVLGHDGGELIGWPTEFIPSGAHRFFVRVHQAGRVHISEFPCEIQNATFGVRGSTSPLRLDSVDLDTSAPWSGDVYISFAPASVASKERVTLRLYAVGSSTPMYETPEGFPPFDLRGSLGTSPFLAARSVYYGESPPPAPADYTVGVDYTGDDADDLTADLSLIP